MCGTISSFEEQYLSKLVLFCDIKDECVWGVEYDLEKYGSQDDEGVYEWRFRGKIKKILVVFNVA